MEEHELATFDVGPGGCLIRCGCGWSSDESGSRSELLDRWVAHQRDLAGSELLER